MGRTWADLKTKDDQRPAKRAPTLLVEVEEDGEHWFIRIREWGLYGQAESLVLSRQSHAISSDSRSASP